MRFMSVTKNELISTLDKQISDWYRDYVNGRGFNPVQEVQVFEKYILIKQNEEIIRLLERIAKSN